MNRMCLHIHIIQLLAAMVRDTSWLQVNHTTRNRFALDYYAKAAFLSYKYADLRAWLNSLTAEHRSLIMDLRYDPLLPPLPPRRELALGDTWQVNVHNKGLAWMHHLVNSVVELSSSGRRTAGRRPPKLVIPLRFRGEEQVYWTDSPIATFKKEVAHS